MGLGMILGSIARKTDRRFGIQYFLNGEPRPPAGGFDIKGEKYIDWGWICTNLPPGQKKALEVGSGQSPIVPAMLALGYDVTAVDLCTDLSQQHAGIQFIKGDFMALELSTRFDVIIACSTVEHIGLSGRYGSQEDPDGDLKAMRKMVALLKPDGVLFLTVPVGADAVYMPWHRVYGRERLPQLIAGLEVVKSRFLTKQPWGPWHETPPDAALDAPAEVRRYGLGEMILRKESAPKSLAAASGETEPFLEKRR